MRQFIGWLLAAILVTLMIFARDQSTAFQTCVNGQQATHAGEQVKESPSDISLPLSERWPIDFRCTGAFLNENNAAITAVATIVIAVFTIVLAVVTGTQARLTKEALIADKRAFIFAASLSPVWEIDKNSGEYYWRFRPVWRNSGETATRDLKIYTDGELRNTSLPGSFDFTQMRTEPGGGLLGPGMDSAGGQAPHMPGAAISPQDILDMQTGRKFFYLWGWVRYNDVFPRTPIHLTRFCWLILAVGDPRSYSPTASQGQPGTLAFHWLAHSKGNSAD